MEAREDHLRQELDRIRESRDVLEHELGVIDQLVRDSTSVRGERRQGRRLRLVEEEANAAPSTTTTLRGAKVREAAVRVLVGTGEPDQAVHYRTWFDLLRRHGFLPAGKDPLATFLTQISRSPLVQRSTEPGVYSLDLAFPERALRQLDALRAELDGVEQLPDDVSVGELARARERREQLRSEIHGVERSLDEARRSLLTG